MQTIELNIYEFSELSDSAKRKAIEWYRDRIDGQHLYDEVIDSVKALCDTFGFTIGRRYSDIGTGYISDSVLDMTGIRLYKHIINHFYSDLFKPRYIKTLNLRSPCLIFQMKGL